MSTQIVPEGEEIEDEVLAFNTVEGWAKDVSKDVAKEMLEPALEQRDLSAATRDFVELHTGEEATLFLQS